MDYINPFLDVILSPETSGPVTGIALTSVLRMLEHYTLGETLALTIQWLRIAHGGTGHSWLPAEQLYSRAYYHFHL